MTCRRRSSRPRCGFTLIELVSTIVVLGALGTVASGIILTATDGYIAAATRAQLHTELSLALDRGVRELRNIQLDTEAGELAPDIDAVEPTSLTWHTDCRLAVSGDALQLTIDGGEPGTLLTDVQSLEIRTYDENNDLLGETLTGAACDPIRRVGLEVAIARSGVSESLRTKVFLRSTMAGAGEGN